MAKRQRTIVVNAPTGATTPFTAPTPDDYLTRRLTGWLVVNAGSTQGVKVSLFKAGYDAADVDAQAFSNTQGPLPLDIEYPIGVQIAGQIANTSGSNQANVAVTLFYEAVGAQN